MPPYSLYLHIPFCRHRCGYCDFNTYAGLEELIPRYVQALCAEAVFAARQTQGRLPVHTVFFGGGTPSLLTARRLADILSTLQDHFDISPDAEISLEANPGTVSSTYLHDLRNLGINRLSLGVQSTHPAELRLLERQHSYLEVIQAFQWARQAGFENLNLDLIFGLPEQSLESWQRNLRLALGLQPEHFSLYALTIEEHTPFGAWLRKGLLSEPDPDLAADMYEWSSEQLEKFGYAQYEISNWARAEPNLSPTASPALACRHNLQYWRGLPYLGLGAGAHGYADHTRTANVLSPAAYIQRLLRPTPEQPSPPSFPCTPANQESHILDCRSEIGEFMMMGLRLTREGISAAGFQQRFGLELSQTFAAQISGLAVLGLLEWAGNGMNVLRLTRKGRLLGNQVFMEFIET
jgi:oxygen-independent coproporphyrinogen-3 oxidase